MTKKYLKGKSWREKNAPSFHLIVVSSVLQVGDLLQLSSSSGLRPWRKNNRTFS